MYLGEISYKPTYRLVLSGYGIVTELKDGGHS